VLARWPAKLASVNLSDHQTSDAEANVSAVGRQN
jgi:hypothetical protein